MKKRSEAGRARRSAAEAQTAFEIDLEAGLNPEQIEVVRHDGGPCRVLACAGAGKTEALGRRIARMVRDGVDPKRILAITFSNKGAGEMNARISEKFGVRGARVGTWHSLCLQILKEDETEQGRWTIEGSAKGASTKTVLKDVLGFREMDWKQADFNEVARYIGWCKANLFEPGSPEATALAQARFGGAGLNARRAVEAFHRYNQALARKGLLSFDDFLVFAAKHLESSEDVRASWASRWDFVLCDEVQDNNAAQVRLATLLAKDHGNYMAIGDVYQSIFGFRASSPRFLAKFDEAWPAAKTITLPRNYRCARSVIAASNGVVAPAKVDGMAEPTAMIGERDLDGAVKHFCAESPDDEAREVVARIRASIESGAKLADHTILVRLNAMTRGLEDALLRAKIPYVVLGGVTFYERKEVKDLLGYLRIACGRAGEDDVKRAVNTPFRYLGTAFLDRLTAAVDGRDYAAVDWSEVILDVVEQQAGIQRRQRDSAIEWSRLMLAVTGMVEAGKLAEPTEEQRDSARPAKLLDYVVRKTDYIAWLNREEGGESTEDSPAANVREMVRVAEQFASADELLDYVDETVRKARDNRSDGAADRVTIMTVHKSKGLEFPHVFVIGLNEIVFPHIMGDEEEERRLAYVAMTRARDTLTLSCVKQISTRAGLKIAKPSRFLADAGVSPEVAVRKCAHRNQMLSAGGHIYCADCEAEGDVLLADNRSRSAEVAALDLEERMS